MGSIVVKAGGKLNGHCLRNIKGNQVIGRLALQSKNYNIQKNQSMGVIRQVFSAWKNETAENRGLWDYYAGKNPVIDRWGNTKYLTGRELYSSCNINTMLAASSMVDVSKFDSNIPAFNPSYFDFSVSGATAVLYGAAYTAGNFVQVNCTPVQNGVINLDPKKIKRVVFWNTDNGEDYNFWFNMIFTGFNFVIGQYYAFSFRVISPSGYCSPYFYYNMLAE